MMANIFIKLIMKHPGDSGSTRLGNGVINKKGNEISEAISALDCLSGKIAACYSAVEDYSRYLYMRESEASEASPEEASEASPEEARFMKELNTLLDSIYEATFDLTAKMSFNKKQRQDRASIEDVIDLMGQWEKSICADIPRLKKFLMVHKMPQICQVFNDARTTCRWVEVIVTRALDTHYDKWANVFETFEPKNGYTWGQIFWSQLGYKPRRVCPVVDKIRTFINRLSLILFYAMRQINWFHNDEITY